MRAGEIEIGPYRAPLMLGDFRPLFSSSLQKAPDRQRRLERGLMGAVALLVNGTLLTALFYAHPPWDALSRRSQQPLDDSEVPVVITESSSLSLAADDFEGATQTSAMGHDESAAQRTTLPHRKPTKQTAVHIQVAAAGQDNDIPPESEQERLSGIYRVQIAARIARSLENDRVAINSCVARLGQNANGAIGEVSLGDCGGDETSRGNLIEAIRQASPLPAPPRADIFQPTIVIRIDGGIHVHLAYQALSTLFAVPAQGSRQQ